MHLLISLTIFSLIFSTYSFITFSFIFLFTLATNYLSAQKCLSFPFYLNSGCISNNIRALFPFKYPMNSEILCFGGIATYRCMWSKHTAPSTNFTSFILHNLMIISLTSFLPDCTWFSFCILGWTLCGMCNSTLCVLNFHWPLGHLLWFSFVVVETHFRLS